MFKQSSRVLVPSPLGQSCYTAPAPIPAPEPASSEDALEGPRSPDAFTPSHFDIPVPDAPRKRKRTEEKRSQKPEQDDAPVPANVKRVRKAMVFGTKVRLEPLFVGKDLSNAMDHVDVTVLGRPNGRKLVMLKIGSMHRPGRIAFRMQNHWRVVDADESGKTRMVRVHVAIARIFVKIGGFIYMGEANKATWTQKF